MSALLHLLNPGQYLLWVYRVGSHPAGETVPAFLELTVYAGKHTSAERQSEHRLQD